MLSYEDSKELKRLGYPQELKEGDWYYFTAKVPTIERQPVLHILAGVGSNYVKVPTTDGMIEGLGRNFIGLIQDDDGRFWAYGMDKVGAIGTFRHKDQEPDQALCELWKKVKTVPSSE